MKWTDISALYRYWRDSPPVHELVALAVRAKPPDREIGPGERAKVGMTYHELEAAMAKGSPLLSVGA